MKRIAALITIIMLCGCMGVQPHGQQTDIEKIELESFILPEGCYGAVPVLAPIFKRGREIRIGSNPNINFTDVSEFSSKIAATFWNSSEKAIIVDNYSNAVMAAPLASYLNIPILYYGSTTSDVLKILGCREKIVFGDIPEDGIKLDNSSFIDYFLNITVPDYIVVTNPYDDKTLKGYYPQPKNTPYTPHLSCLAPVFAAHYNGIILTVNSNPMEIDKKIEDLCMKIKERGGKSRYLLLIGDSVSLPFLYYWFETLTPNGGTWWFCTPSDNPYADLDGKTNFEHKQGDPVDEKLLAPELSAGRLIADTLEDAFDYAYRIFNYKNSFSGWEKNALIWCGALAETGEGHNLLVQSSWMMGLFSVKDDTLQAHTFDSATLVKDMQNSNFIAAVADHGSPSGNTVSYGDLKKLPPNIVLPVSCLMGQIDNYESDWGVAKKNSFTYAVLKSGCAAYIAATRPTVCGLLLMQGEGLILAHEDAGILCWQFYDTLIKNNCTVGDALRAAKPNVHAYINMEYELYGDPAFNPYEPCNEG